MMEAARTPETLVDIQLRTRQYIPEDSELSTGVTMTMDIILTITMLLLLCNNGLHTCRFTTSKEKRDRHEHAQETFSTHVRACRTGKDVKRSGHSLIYGTIPASIQRD
jgi:hypothetical protein